MSIKFRKPPRHIIGYFRDPSTWDSQMFETLIRDELESVYGTIAPSDETLIAALIIVTESLMQAQQKINEEGAVAVYASGVGSSAWTKLRNESIDKIIKILGEMGLVSRGRPKKVNKPTEVDELFATA